MTHQSWCLSNAGFSCNCGAEGADSTAKALEIQQLYQNVFSSKEGLRVLGNMVQRGRLFEVIDPTDTVGIAYRNVALDVLQLSGIINPLYAQLGLGSEKGE